MRMVEADDVEAGRSRVAPCLNVILRIDQKPIGVVREIARADGGRDDAGRSDEKTAALRGGGFARVRDDRLADRRRKNHSVSMTIAVPMPPPMQSAAIPYRSFFARSAYTSVVRIRAPLAPIGWPSAIAPPVTFTLAASSSSSRATASA